MLSVKTKKMTRLFTEKNYPIQGAKRRIYVQTSARITEKAVSFYVDHIGDGRISTKDIGKYMAMNVLLKGGGHYIGNPTIFETEQECKEACMMQNRANGFSQEEVEQVLHLSFFGTVSTKLKAKK